jgi:hypothetical protein
MTTTTAEHSPTVTPTDRVLVSFAGSVSGVEEMSWGQWEIWLSMRDQESALPIGGTKPLTDMTVDDVTDELRYLLSRFESMRTRLRFDATGRPVQVVSDSGEIALEIYDAADADPDEVAAAVEADYRATPFDYENDWPVRMAVIRDHGVLTHMVVIMCHMVTDGTGATVMIAEVAARVTTPVDGMQPLAQAQWQRSPAGQRQNTTAVRHWESVLRGVPQPWLPAGFGDPQSPRHWQGQLDSPALLLAVRSICARTRIESAPVLLALFAVALARVTGISPVMTRPIVSNRFRRGLADVVAVVAQNGICSLDVADISLDEAIRRAQRGAMTAYKHAYFDAEKVYALIARLTEERAPDFNIGCFFNDRRVMHRSATTGAAPSPRQQAEMLPLTTFRWVRTQHNPVDRLFVHIDDVPDTMQITIDIDTHHVSPAHAEALTRGMESAAVEAALDPTAPTRVASSAPTVATAIDV